jgi:hypothetical protein
MHKRLLIALSLILLVAIQGAYGLKIVISGGNSGGSFSEGLNLKVPKDGGLTINSIISNGELASSGSGDGGLNLFYRKTSGDKRSTAEIKAAVTGDFAHWRYSDPGQGTTFASASLTNFKLTATEADTISCTAEAKSTGLYDVVGKMEVSDPNGHQASLTDFTSSAVANGDKGFITQNGNVHGILDRSLGDAINPAFSAGSNGIVDATLKEKASVHSGGLINYETSGLFYVDQAGTANKIQDAVNAAFKGDNIKVAAGTYYENVFIPTSVEIVGEGSDKTIVDGSKPANPNFGSVFTIEPDAEVSLSKMAIKGGSGTKLNPLKDAEGGGIVNFGTLTLDNVLITDNTVAYAGGGIWSSGTLNLNSGTSITGNNANGIDDDTGFGGGIYNRGTVNMNRGSSITHNSAHYGGAGIYNDASLSVATVNMNEGSSIYDNNAIFGGGIFSLGPSASVTMNADSSIHDNNAIVTGGGGGIYNWYGTVAINSGSSIFNNNAGYMGGGILNDDGTIKMDKGSSIYDNTVYSTDEQSGFGGGIYSNAGSIDISGSIFGNTAPQSGGGIYEKYAIVTINKGGSIYDNNAIFGGGIFSYGQVYMNSGSSIHNNKANFGGGIYNFLGTVGMDSGSSITDNTASSIFGIGDSGAGGGIYNYAGPTPQGGFGVGYVVMKSGSYITRNTANIGGGIYNRYDPINNDYGVVTFVDSKNKEIPIYDPNNNDYLHFFGPWKAKPDSKPDDVYYP